MARRDYAHLRGSDFCSICRAGFKRVLNYRHCRFVANYRLISRSGYARYRRRAMRADDVASYPSYARMPFSRSRSLQVAFVNDNVSNDRSRSRKEKASISRLIPLTGKSSLAERCCVSPRDIRVSFLFFLSLDFASALLHFASLRFEAYYARTREFYRLCRR